MFQFQIFDVGIGTAVMTQFTSLRIGRPRSNCRRLGSWHLATTEASQAGVGPIPPSDFGRAQAEIIARRRWSVTGGARPPRKTVPRFTRGVQAWNTPPRRYVWGASQSSAGHPGFHAAPEATLRHRFDSDEVHTISLEPRPNGNLRVRTIGRAKF